MVRRTMVRPRRNLPFLAAFLVGLGKGAGPPQAENIRPSVITAPDVSHECTAVTAILTYLRPP